MVLAQLAEQSLPTPELCSSKPNIGNLLFGMYLSANCYQEKTKINKKRLGMAHLKKTFLNLLHLKKLSAEDPQEDKNEKDVV